MPRHRPAPGSPIFTCPSCRASVRDTKHNATVATLLDMLLTAQPDKRRPEEERGELDKIYKPGDKVLPKVNFLERTADQRRLDEEHRRLIDDVREMSLRDAVSVPRRLGRGQGERRAGHRGRGAGQTHAQEKRAGTLVPGTTARGVEDMV